MSTETCRICNNTENNRNYLAQENLIGTKEVFEYFQCSVCKCLQITKPLSSLDSYYPKNYYSYNAVIKHKGLKRVLYKYRNQFALFKKNHLGRLLYNKYPNLSLKSLSYIPQLNTNMKILDVGCGSGSLLFTLKETGFDHLLGIDPYIESGIKYENSLRVVKQDLQQTTGKWDIVMFHHSFEHLLTPEKDLRSAYELLNNNGYCLIRIPTVSSYAWKHYGVSWVQLDAPRHIFLHSIKSINMISDRIGFDVENIIYDSTAFQFVGSEKYLKGIPLLDKSQDKELFNGQTLKKYKKLSDELNRNNQGDQMIVILKKNIKS